MPPAGPRIDPTIGPRIEPPRPEPAGPPLRPEAVRPEAIRPQARRPEVRRPEVRRPEPVRAESNGRGGGEPPHFAPVSELPDETRWQKLTLLAGLVLVLLVALPAFVLIRDSAKDPVASNLDALSLPAWAAVAHDDENSGSRWCLETCRWHERTWRSTKPAKDTDATYRTALSAAGWSPLTTGCPAAPGTGS